MLVISISTTLNLAKAANSELAVFPGAEGYGTKTVAGSGRNLATPSTNIIHVTNISDAGAGSLRACLEAASARTCVFEISGRIHLKKPIVIKNPYLTIAGQTAPAPGILISGAGIQISAHDVLMQHLQIRVGDDRGGYNPEYRDGVTIAALKEAVYNVVVDRVSISWAIDENLSTFSNVSEVTISNSIISEALYKSIHPKGPHGMAFIIGNNTKRISVHNNLFAHNNERNPRIKAGTEVEFANNIVYNWGGKSGWYMANLSDMDNSQNPIKLNFMGNYYIAGNNSPKAKTIFAQGVVKSTKIYVKDNIDPFRKTLTEDDWNISSIDRKYRSLEPSFSRSNYQTMHPLSNYSFVLNYAGARVSESNSVDERVKADVLARSGSIKDCVSGCVNTANGYPEMPVTIRALELPQNPHNDDNGNGYTNLEEWIHSFSNTVQDISNKVKVPDLDGSPVVTSTTTSITTTTSSTTTTTTVFSFPDLSNISSAITCPISGQRASCSCSCI